MTLLDPDLAWIKADAGQLEQVLLNLVVNARDAMPDGGKLVIETTNVTLGRDHMSRHAEVIPGEYVMLRVSDTGIGMAEEIRAHIFEPFFTTKEMGKGTGLGLATCFGIVKQSNGHIEVDSELNQGTTFKIYLPRSEEAASFLAGLAKDGDFPRGTETVLVVEDEMLVRELAVRTLRGQGYTVLEATNGEEALRMARGQEGHNIHLLLTDVIMPRLGGKELVNQLKTERPNLKVMFMSGYADKDIVRDQVSGAQAVFLQKPFLPETLAYEVRNALDV